MLGSFVLLIGLLTIGTLVKMSEDSRFSEKFVALPFLKNACELIAVWTRIQSLRLRCYRMSFQNRILRLQNFILRFKSRHSFILFGQSFSQHGRKRNFLQNIQYSHEIVPEPNAHAHLDRPERAVSDSAEPQPGQVRCSAMVRSLPCPKNHPGTIRLFLFF